MTPSSHSDRHTILPLPEDAVAQIKSSTAIVSLHGVVLALLENSIDAKSTKIQVTVDFARGACTVEDNGLGIAPIEFGLEGGLGKLYCTSKYKACETLLGRYGTFLASLSSVSLLSITSRHYQHRSTNAITLHHAKIIERQLPALSQHEIHDNHGTRVIVRNLFGNLPVRVKQRAKVLEQKAENDRLWSLMKTSVVGLLLSWGGSMSLRARNADNHIIFNFNTSSVDQLVRNTKTDAPKPKSAHLTSLLLILTQANHISVNDWPSWVPVSASTPALFVKGAISLEPAPTKNVQFISIGIRPLPAEARYNEFYEEVNRLFKLSSFGTIEDDTLDSLEKVRRQYNKSTEHQTFTHRQLRARKGVDQYPMFHLRIALREDLSSKIQEERFIEDETNIQSILSVLGAMVTQWLSAHHFCPKQPRQRHNAAKDSLVAYAETSEGENRSTSAPQSVNPPSLSVRATFPSSTRATRPHTSGSFGRKRKRGDIVFRESDDELSQHAFAKWSRIKAAKSDFFANYSGLRKPKPVASSQIPTMSDQSALIYRSGRTEFASFSTQSTNRGALGTEMPGEDEHCQTTDAGTTVDGSDESLSWTDPMTKKKHLLNARTGCVMRTGKQSHDDVNMSSAPSISQNRLSKTSLRLPPKTATVGDAPWLDTVLSSWENPVFKASEKRIGQLFTQENDCHRMQQCATLGAEKTSNNVPPTDTIKLSKKDLVNAEVIAQVDKKFILIKVNNPSKINSTTGASTATLVLIDQHAADERIQVEILFQELCIPATPGYKSGLGHSAHIASNLLPKPIQFSISLQERTHFITYAATFAAWGILFDMLDPPILSENANSSAKPQHRLSVTALPPAIAERCNADAHLLISLLRSTVWKYASELPLPHPGIDPLQDEPASWVRQLATCPEGLVDMINSRACRSAVMFNDELDLEHCRHLVKKLASCVFPFMCAHGRPSLVPLGDIDGFGRVGEIVEGREGQKSFVQAWKTWKR